jgi:hypothetical protein
VYRCLVRSITTSRGILGVVVMDSITTSSGAIAIVLHHEVRIDNDQ